MRTGAVLVDVAAERDRTWQGRGPQALARVAASIERSLAADGARFSADGTPSAALQMLLRLELEALDAGGGGASSGDAHPVAVYYLETDGDFVSLRRPLPCEIEDVSLCAVPRWSPEPGVGGTHLASDAAVMVRRVAADAWGERQAAYAVQADGSARRLYAYHARDERGGRWYVASLKRTTLEPAALTTYNGTRASALHMVTGRRTHGVSHLGVLGADYPLSLEAYLAGIPVADATTMLLVLRARGRAVLAARRGSEALPVTDAAAAAARDAVFEQVPRLTSGPGAGSGNFSRGGVAHAFDAVGVDGGGWDSDFVLATVWVDEGAAKGDGLCAADTACYVAWRAAAREGRTLTVLGVRSRVAAEVAAAADAVAALDADRRAGLLVADDAAWCAGNDTCQGVVWEARTRLQVALKGAAAARSGLSRVWYVFRMPQGERVCGFVRVADGVPPLQVWETCEDGAAGPPGCAGGVALFQGDDASAPVGEVHAGHRVDEEEWFRVSMEQTTSKVHTHHRAPPPLCAFWSQTNFSFSSRLSDCVDKAESSEGDRTRGVCCEARLRRGRDSGAAAGGRRRRVGCRPVACDARGGAERRAERRRSWRRLRRAHRVCGGRGRVVARGRHRHAQLQRPRRQHRTADPRN